MCSSSCYRATDGGEEGVYEKFMNMLVQLVKGDIETSKFEGITCVYVYICMYVCVCVWMYLCVCVCVCVRARARVIYIYVYTYIHTYIHMYRRLPAVAWDHIY